MPRQGIWTPTADVICYECHGPRFKQHFGRPDKVIDISSDEWKALIDDSAPAPSEKHVTSCDRCGRDIQFRYDSVPVEHNMVLALRELGVDAFMDQTGGMNSACAIRTTDGGYYYVVYSWEGDGTYSIARYDWEDEWVEGVGISGATEEEAAQFIDSITDLKYLEGDVNDREEA